MLGTPITRGFNYDQQAEPVGPLAGQLWRERSSGGLIVGEWEWNGVFWRSVTTYCQGFVVTSVSVTTILGGEQILNGLFLNSLVQLLEVRYFTRSTGVYDATNNWTLTVDLLDNSRQVATNRSAIITASTLLLNATASNVLISQSFDLSSFVTNGVVCRLIATRAGTAAALSPLTATLSYKRIRQ